MVDFNEMSKREYDELGFLYEQRYGPYKPFKEWIIVDDDINPYIRQLMDIVYETEVDKININIVEKFLFNRISREESRKILSLLLKNNIISEQGMLLMNNDKYSEFIHNLLDKAKPPIKAVEQEEIKYGIQKEEDGVSETLDNEMETLSFKALFTYIILIVLSLFLCSITYRIFGVAFLIPAFIIIGASLYKYTR